MIFKPLQCIYNSKEKTTIYILILDIYLLLKKTKAKSVHKNDKTDCSKAKNNQDSINTEQNIVAIYFNNLHTIQL